MKRIITCSDGTWNEPNASDNGRPVRTNVQKMFDYIVSRDAQNVPQIKYYDAGVGSEGSWITRLFNGATGKGIDENIQDIYKFIVWNYEQGADFSDEIFLFGFSRGAYTARSLVGMIRKCGILRKSNLNLLADAYQLYRDHNAAPDSEKAKAFRRENSYEVSRVKFIGVWDTVGALGIPLNMFQRINKKKYAFYDTTLSSLVEHAYHAVSIDEQRKNFEPTLWKPSTNTTREFRQILEQRWFAGVHSNVGGGYPDEGLADIALKWMIDKAIDAGLALDQQRIQHDVRGNVQGKLYNSRSGIFSLGKPFVRPITEGPIDDTVHERIRQVADYRPKNVK
jgi:uncharacterized protein (DUF2235 family)